MTTRHVAAPEENRDRPSELRFSWVAIVLALAAGVIATLLVQATFPDSDTSSNAVSRHTATTLSLVTPTDPLPATTTTTSPSAQALVVSPRLQKMMLSLGCTLTGDADFVCPGPDEHNVMVDIVTDEARCRSDDEAQQLADPEGTLPREDCDGDGNPG